MRGDSGYAYLPAGQAEIEFAKYEQRIKSLEAEIDRMRPVVQAALSLKERLNDDNLRLTMQQRLDRLVKLHNALEAYEGNAPKVDHA